MTTLSFPTAPDAIRAAINSGILKAGDWGDGTEAVCMMSAIVRGAQSRADCVTAGWPEWLAGLNVWLFDRKVGADDEDAARAAFALDVAVAVSKPFDADKARGLFLIKQLETGDYSALKSLRMKPVDADWWRDCEAAVVRVADLLKRRMAGADVTDELADARSDARSDAYAAADARSDARAARAAAIAAARADLVASITEAQIQGEPE